MNDINLMGVSFRDREAIDYYSLHGSVLDSTRQLRFGTLDIAEAFSSDPSRWIAFQNLLSKNPTIFWGYRLEDAGTLQVLANAARENNQRDIWIITSSTNNETSAYYKALGLNIINSNTEEFLNYLSSEDWYNPYADSGGQRISTKELFPQYYIPSHGEFPNRPIKSYFQGRPPEWSDIYSPLIVKTSHFDNIRECIAKGRSVFVAGGTATGKSTLLLQAAAFTETPFHKLVLSSPSKNKVKFILNKLSGEKAIVFIDDCTDDIDSFVELAKSKNVQVVGADRDYNYLSAIHRFKSSIFDVVEVSELDPSDVQAVVKSVPIDLKRDIAFNPQLAGGVESSIFEVVEANCRTKNLQDRFDDMIADFSGKDDKLLDTITLSCYVHSCRCPVSMDMLLSYWHGSISNYMDIYDLMATIGSTVAEYFGYLVDDDQDYFTVRSNLVSEVLLLRVPPKVLRRVLIKFIENVSTLHISGYNIFKRKGYDARLFEKAFPDVIEGEKMYDFVYKKDSSPFMLQQKALYLSRRGYHERAFQVIDLAISKAGSKNWAIKNSHAIILFRANIRLVPDANARKSLNESMSILTECYKWDKRKPFHAMTFADHAARYWDAFRDEQAHKYLLQSKQWLEDELRTSSTNLADLRRLRGVIKSKISQFR